MCYIPSERQQVNHSERLHHLEVIAQLGDLPIGQYLLIRRDQGVYIFY